MTYITEVIRRLKALLLLGGELDANYRAASARTLAEIPQEGTLSTVRGFVNLHSVQPYHPPGWNRRFRNDRGGVGGWRRSVK
jgi:hypothetical protein